MKSLKELVDLLSPNKLKKINLLDLHASPESKINKLYRAISNGKVKTEEEAQDLLYGDLKHASAYGNVKKRLRERLLNTLFFIDVDGRKVNDRQRAIIEVERDLSSALILLAKGAKRSGEDILKRCLRKAIKFEFVGSVLYVSRVLRLQHGTTRNRRKDYIYYSELHDEYKTIDRWEELAENRYADLMSRYLAGKEDPELLSEEAKKYYEEVSEALPEVDTYRYRFFTTLIRFLQYTIKNDYPPVIPISKEAIKFFKTKPYTAKTPIQQCLHHQLVAYMQLKDYKRGYQVAKQGEELLEEGENNWFKNREYLLLLALHTSYYQEAYKHYKEAVGHRRFEFLTEEQQRYWGIYRAYLHFLIRQKLIKPNPGDRDFSTQKHNKMLSEPVREANERRRTNIPLLIIQTVSALELENRELASAKIGALEKYSYRNLYEQGGMRPFFFIRLLSDLNKAEFDREKATLQAEKHLKELSALEGTNSTPFHKMEIIPFEKLWEMVLDLAAQKC
ncbi:MAG: hypothetical protein AAGF87_10035 [Bacteroidota bacterium]